MPKVNSTIVLNQRCECGKPRQVPIDLEELLKGGPAAIPEFTHECNGAPKGGRAPTRAELAREQGRRK